MARFLKKDFTTSVNGVFIMIVFTSHLRDYITIAPKLDYFMSRIGQMMVVTFLFYSGFGVMESIRKRGMDYVKRIPVHRVLGVWAMFVPVVIIYGVMDLIIGIPFTWDKALLSLVAWLNLGNSNWYIFVILCLYLFTWIAWMLADSFSRFFFKNSTQKELLRDTCGLIVLTLITAVFAYIMKQTVPNYYYNTLTAYLFGIFFSLNKDRLLRACGFDENGKLSGLPSVVCYIAMTGLMILTTYFLRNHIDGDLMHMLMALFFGMGVVLLSYLLPFPDIVFHWLGEHLFEIFILMRIPMIIMKQGIGWEEGGIWFALISLAVTLLLSWGYHAAVVAVKARIGRSGKMRQA